MRKKKQKKLPKPNCGLYIKNKHCSGANCPDGIAKCCIHCKEKCQSFCEEAGYTLTKKSA